MAPTLGVVVPAFEPDVEALRSLLADLEAELDPDALRVELDAPAPGVAESLEDAPGTVTVARDRRGKGAAVTAGFEALGTDVLAFVDADGSVPAASFADVVAPVVADRVDLAVGSRRHPEADVRSHQTFARRLLGDGFAALARKLLDVRLYDYQCGAKAMNRRTWDAVRGHLHARGFAWDVELVAMTGAVGGRIEEVPVVWIDRPGSTVDTLGTTVALGRTLLAARRRASRLRDRRDRDESLDDESLDQPGDAGLAERPPADND